MTGNPTDTLLFYEDMEVSSTQSFGGYQVTRKEVTDFAGRYDPQAFHLSDAAAAETHFGRISASGWHTCAMTMRMLVDNMAENRQAGLGSPGVDQIRWKKPVYPGDVLHCETKLLDKKRSRSRPEMGSFRSTCTTFNQHDEPVLEMISIGLIRTRNPAGSD